MNKRFGWLTRLWAGGLALGSLLVPARPAAAAMSSKTLLFNVDIAVRGKIVLSGGTGAYRADLSIVNTDPSLISQSFNPLTVKCKVILSHGKSATLTVQASGDLSDGVDANIPVSQIVWTGTGRLKASGRLSATTGQNLDDGTWSASGIYTGTLTYTYNLTGTEAANVAPYTTTLTYTLATL